MYMHFIVDMLVLRCVRIQVCNIMGIAHDVHPIATWAPQELEQEAQQSPQDPQEVRVAG